MFKFFVSVLLFATSLAAKESWQTYKKATLSKMVTFPGDCSKEKAALMMDLLKNTVSTSCLEIGTFSDRSLFALTKTLKYQRKGKVFAIDTGSVQQLTKILKKNRLDKYCQFLQQFPINASPLFGEETLDFIHIAAKGCQDVSVLYQEARTYLPKLKNGGYLLLSNPNIFGRETPLVYLLENMDLISPFYPKAHFYLFRKNKQREEKARQLMN